MTGQSILANTGSRIEIIVSTKTT